jgi:hypothetical protein
MKGQTMTATIETDDAEKLAPEADSTADVDTDSDTVTDEASETDAETETETETEIETETETEADAEVKSKNMWLDRKRAQTYRLPEEFITSLHELYADGTAITRSKLTAIERNVFKRERTFRWETVVARVLTTVGQAEFNTRVNAYTVENATSAEIALDLQRAKFYRARAAWRKKYNVNPHATLENGEAATALAELEKLNQPGQTNVTQLRKFQVQTLAELMTDHLRPELVGKPKALSLKPGEVLVTWRTLQQLGSCGTYVERFRDRWPEGTIITKEICVENYDDFEWGWAASQLLLSGGHHRWERAYYREEEELRRRLRELRRTYDERRDELRQLRVDGKLSAEELTRKQTEIKNDYDRISTVVNRELRTCAARMFADLYADQPRPDLASYGE